MNRNRSLGGRGIAGLVVALAMLFGAHVVVYYGISLAFGISSPGGLVALALVLAGLTTGFVVTLLLARRFTNPLLRVLYRIFATWTGLFLYLVPASVIGLLARVPSVGEIAYAAAVLVTILGLVQAVTIRITPYRVRLRNLPDFWKGKTIAFVSDVHLGHVYGASFARRITRKINRLRPELVLVGGDLYDGTAIDAPRAVAPFAELDAPLGTYFVTGNHDQYGDEAAYLQAIRGVGMTVLDNRSVEVEGLQIAGVDYFDTADRDRYESLIGTVPVTRALPTVFVRHVPSYLDVAERAGMDLHLSGHTHRAQVFPFQYVTRAVYRGFDYGLRTLGAMQVITSSGVGNWGPPVRVGSRSEIVSITFE